MNAPNIQTSHVKFRSLKIPPTIGGILKKITLDDVFGVVKEIHPELSDSTLLQHEMWSELNVLLIENIYKCLPSTKYQLSTRRKMLVTNEFHLIQEWASRFSSQVPTNVCIA